MGYCICHGVQACYLTEINRCCVTYTEYVLLLVSENADFSSTRLLTFELEREAFVAPNLSAVQSVFNRLKAPWR